MDDKTCSKVLTVSGKGVFDTFDLSCNTGSSNAVTSLGTEKFAVYRNPQEHLTFFTNTPSTLILIEGQTCTKRTYKTSKSTTTYTTSDMSVAECKKAAEEMEEAEKEWQREFDEHMKKTFPPCFPFCDSEDEDDSSSQQGKHHKNDHDSDEDDDSDDDKDHDDDDSDEDDWNF